MKNKIILYVGAILLTFILFGISTYTQKKLINYEPKIECLFVKEDISQNEKLKPEMFYKDEIDLSIVANTKIIQNFSEIDGLYAKDNIYKGQIALNKQFETKEKLSIYEFEEGKEKISIKIKSSENGVSYSIKKNTLVNVYVTLRADMTSEFLNNKEKLTIGTIEDGYTVIKLLQKVNVLDAFDIDGNKIEESDTKIIDTIIIAVTPEEAKEINLLREIATFNIVEINNENTNVQIDTQDIDEINTNSGEQTSKTE